MAATNANKAKAEAKKASAEETKTEKTALTIREVLAMKRKYLSNGMDVETMEKRISEEYEVRNEDGTPHND